MPHKARHYSQQPTFGNNPRPRSRHSAECGQDARKPYSPQGSSAPATNRGDRGPLRRSRIALAVFGVILIVLLAIYAAGFVIFSNSCYPNTIIAGVDVSLMGRSTAISRVKSSAEGYRLTIAGDGFNWAYDPDSVHEVIDVEGSVSCIIDANEPYLWPLKLYRSLIDSDDSEDDSIIDSGEEISIDDVLLPSSFDRETFISNLGSALDSFNAERLGTFDAVSAYDDTLGKLTLQKALANRKLDKDKVIFRALTAVSTLDKTVELDESSYIPLGGGATESELQEALDAANSLMGVNVDIVMGGSKVASLDGATFSQWITFDEKLCPVLSTEPLTAWVRELAQTKLDTVGSQRVYTRPDGKTVVVGGGTYGWNSDEAELVRLLNDAIANSHVGSVEVPVLRAGRVWTGMGERDWGAYCDVDLSEQKCRYYDDGDVLLWESNCITGNPNDGNGTATGVYQLNSKKRDVTLVGLDLDDDGEPDYKSPVDYWLPFVDNMIGLHDANWQPDELFGRQDAYLTRGSKGCINLPTDKAAELFNLIQVGDCVIVHE